MTFLPHLPLKENQRRTPPSPAYNIDLERFQRMQLQMWQIKKMENYQREVRARHSQFTLAEIKHNFYKLLFYKTELRT